jgi:pimeloyl-ACP methyl ester carboxylesterase
VLAHWSNGFDWRAHEARLNRLPQYRARIGGDAIHFVHQPGTGPAPMPLILTHGWPGSFLEMERLIPLLADPGAHGGDPADAFHVVVPSLPGFGFSSTPASTGTYETAALWCTLMEGLGYARFGAQGGDLGAGVSAWLGQRYPDQIIGMHVNWVPGSYRPPLEDGAAPVPTLAEAAFQQRAAQFTSEEGAYASVQGTKPITLAAGLNDSPAGLAAWIAEKFAAWSQDFEGTIGLDTLLTNISLYWFTQTIATSFRMYVEGRARPLALLERIAPPLGVALSPAELPMPPRSWVERGFNVRRWTDLPAGGHFAALEAPALLAEDIRAFFRPLRARP